MVKDFKSSRQSRIDKLVRSPMWDHHWAWQLLYIQRMMNPYRGEYERPDVKNLATTTDLMEKMTLGN